jgi:hypothetical protein
MVVVVVVVVSLMKSGLNTGPAEEGLTVVENIPALMACGITCPSMDLVSPTILQVPFAYHFMLHSDVLGQPARTGGCVVVAAW